MRYSDNEVSRFLDELVGWLPARQTGGTILEPGPGWDTQQPRGQWNLSCHWGEPRLLPREAGKVGKNSEGNCANSGE